MTKKFLLQDDCDAYYTDLITFDEPVDMLKVHELIVQCKKDLEGEYTNEDIYHYLDKLNVNYTIEWLGDYPTLYY